MNLRERKSNNTEFMATILKEDQTSSVEGTVLGMQWNTTSDHMPITQVNPQERVVKTKRDLISTISKFNAPLGRFSPVIVRAKLLIQEVWKLGIVGMTPCQTPSLTSGSK